MYAELCQRSIVQRGLTQDSGTALGGALNVQVLLVKLQRNVLGDRGQDVFVEISRQCTEQVQLLRRLSASSCCENSLELPF